MFSLNGWLPGCLSGWLPSSLANCLAGLLADWRAGWLAMSLANWLANIWLVYMIMKNMNLFRNNIFELPAGRDTTISLAERPMLFSG